MQEYPPQPKQEFWQPYPVQHQQFQPPPQQPQYPQQSPKRGRGKLFLAIGCGALVLVIIIVAAITLVVGSNPSPGKNAATVSQKLAVATPAGILLGPQPCPPAVQSTNHWKTKLGLNASQQVEGVLCGYLVGAPSLQAVVKVRYKGTDDLLDIDVYTNITSAQQSSVFSLKGLPHGDVIISNYNTLMTSEIEAQPNQGAGVASTTGQQDLYREFKWSDSAGTLVQITFPGFFPDLTRYQAEYEQNQVNTGQGYQQWRLSAVTTAQNFAEFVLGWDPNAPTTVLNGGGKNDAKALILVKNPSAENATIKLSLSRLELNTNGGIWEVTGVATDGITITSPQDAQQLTSPVQVASTGKALVGKTTTIKVFDHDRTVIGQAILNGSGSTGKSNYATTSISYSSSFPGKTQEGILALYTYTANHVIDGAVMVKVLLSA
jgi:hypothetical protein